MVRRSGGNKTKEYSRELLIVGLDSDPYDLPKNQWSTTDINIWTYINFGDFYRLCTNSGRMKEFLLTLWYRIPVAPDGKAVRPLVCSKNIKNCVTTHQNKGVCGEMKT